jgi:SWI/SNF-related matrix-associated actin-dependent regulator of chromatin subfamily D
MLRIFLSHTVSGQVWQQPETGDTTHNFDTGQGIPSWQLKIEGRVLEVGTGSTEGVFLF